MACWDKRPIIYCLSLSLYNDSCRVSEVDSVAGSRSHRELVPTPSLEPFAESFSVQLNNVLLLNFTQRCGLSKSELFTKPLYS